MLDAETTCSIVCTYSLWHIHGIKHTYIMLLFFLLVVCYKLFGTDSFLCCCYTAMHFPHVKKNSHVRTLPASMGGFEPGSLGRCVLRPQPYEHRHPPNGRVSVHRTGLLYLNASDATPYIIHTLIE